MKNFYKNLILFIKIFAIFSITAFGVYLNVAINKAEETEKINRRIEETKRYWYFEDGSKIKASKVFDYYGCESN